MPCKVICDFWWCKAKNECRNMRSFKAKVEHINRMEREFPLLPYVRHIRKETPSKIKKEVLARDNYQCRYCKSIDEPTIDHVIPLCRGGENTVDNMQTLCKKCNEEKAGKILDF